MGITTRTLMHDQETGKMVKSVMPDTKDVKVTKSEDEDGNTVYEEITVPVSSRTQDRDGDQFVEDGLKDLVKQYKSGKVPLYLDHGLSPETMFPDYRVLEQRGVWKDATLNDDNIVMAKAKLRENDEEAQELGAMIDEGMAVGFSVGFIIQSANELDTGNLEFESVDLLETSGVGIPSNPDGVTQAASQSAVAVKNALEKREDKDSINPEAVSKAIGDALEKAGEHTDRRTRDEDSRIHAEGPKMDKSEGDEHPHDLPEDTSDIDEGNTEGKEPDHLEETLQEIMENQQELMERVEQLEESMEEDDDEDEDDDNDEDDDGEDSGEEDTDVETDGENDEDNDDPEEDEDDEDNDGDQEDEEDEEDEEEQSSQPEETDDTDSPEGEKGNTINTLDEDKNTDNEDEAEEPKMPSEVNMTRNRPKRTFSDRFNR